MTDAPEEEGHGLGTETEKDASPDLIAERGQTDLAAETADRIVLTGLLTVKTKRGGRMIEERRDPCLHALGDTLPPLQGKDLATGQGEQGQDADNLQVRAMTE